MNSLSICSLNTNGIRNRKKRHTLFKYIKDKKYDIACLQETFITSDVKDLWEREWGGTLIFSPGTTNSLGQLVLFKKNFPFAVDIELICNRLISFSFSTDKGLINVVNAYAPTVAGEKKPFLDLLSNHLSTLQGDFIVCGDMNCVANNDIDIISGNKHSINDVQDFNNFILDNSLNDTWRLFHHEEKEYSWSRNNPFTARRLDYIFTSDCIFNSVLECNLVSYAQSDHRLVEMKYSLVEIKRGPSYWKFNDSILKDRVYTEQMNRLLEEYSRENQNIDDRLKWDLCKIKIRDFTITYSKRKANTVRNEKKALEQELNNTEKLLALDPNNIEINNRKDTLKNKLAIYQINE